MKTGVVEGNRAFRLAYEMVHDRDLSDAAHYSSAEDAGLQDGRHPQVPVVIWLRWKPELPITQRSEVQVLCQLLGRDVR
jgi:hypothetical protein